MIDRDSRRLLAEALRRLGWGRITNDEFEDKCHPLLQSEDAAIRSFFDAAWGLYSDIDAHKLRGRQSLSKRQKKVLARMILFLHTDHEYLGPAMGLSRRGALVALLAIAAGILFYNLSQWFAVILLSLAILICILKVFSIVLSGIVKVMRWPRKQFRWLGLDRKFFLQNPTWPFAAFKDYRTALNHPPYFAGKT